MAETNERPAWGYQLENWMNIGTPEVPEWLKVTELLSWEESAENQSYTPSWIDRKNQPTFILGKTTSITWEKDTLIGGLLEAWVMKNRNKTDVPVEIVSVYTWLGSPEAMTADKAGFLFTPNKAKNSNVAQPVVLGGTCNMESDGWTEGTWDSTQKAFAEGAPEEEEAQG